MLHLIFVWSNYELIWKCVNQKFYFDMKFCSITWTKHHHHTPQHLQIWRTTELQSPLTPPLPPKSSHHLHFTYPYPQYTLTHHTHKHPQHYIYTLHHHFLSHFHPYTLTLLTTPHYIWMIHTYKSTTRPTPTPLPPWMKHMFFN